MLVTGLPEDEGVGVRQLAAGAAHSLALLTNGDVWAWGSNSWGQLGNKTTTPQPHPVRVIGLTDVEEIAADEYHSLARRGDGSLWAWGDNRWGQLGLGDRYQRTEPVQVSPRTPLQGVTAIAAGHRHCLAVTLAGAKPTVWAWGHNDWGQLGPRIKRTDCYPIAGEVIVFETLPAYLEVAAGQNDSLALRGDGVVMAWGWNNAGQLGDGTTKSRALPADVQLLPRGPDEIAKIAAGAAHCLALNLGVHADLDAGVWAWGWNWHGALGDGTTVDRHLPVRVVGPGGKGYLTKVIAIDANARSSLALRGSDGTVWAWGDNKFGQLGDGTTTESREPKQVIIAPFGPGTTAAMEHIAAGTVHSLAAGQILPP